MGEQFPNLAKVTNNLDFRLLGVVGENLSLYPMDVQVEYQAYLEFQAEYEQWLDQQYRPNFMQDY